MANNGKGTTRAGERARDEQREGGPRYGGAGWEIADERGDRRYGHARNDDAAVVERDDEAMQMEAEEIEGEEERVVESSGQRTGIGRPEKPRRTKGS